MVVRLVRILLRNISLRPPLRQKHVATVVNFVTGDVYPLSGPPLTRSAFDRLIFEHGHSVAVPHLSELLQPLEYEIRSRFEGRHGLLAGASWNPVCDSIVVDPAVAVPPTSAPASQSHF
jgi:hypothetical protein